MASFPLLYRSKSSRTNERCSSFVNVIWSLALTISTLATHPLLAQVSINNLDPFIYLQNFDNLSMVSEVWLNNATLPGWYAASSPTVGGVLTPTYLTTCTKSSGTSNPGLFSFGTPSGSTERALGSGVRDDSGEIAYGVLFHNNSGQLIQSITISLSAEQWRRTFEQDHNGHQRVKVSYAIGNTVDVTAAGLFADESFIEIPEAYLISIDTTTKSASNNLDGNNVTAHVSVTFPVSFPANWQFFLRFHDENAKGVDVPLALDNLNVTFFSTLEAPRITATSDYTAFSYLDMGIISNIPDEDSLIPYYIPTEIELDDWELIFENFYSDNWVVTDASAYGYEVIHFTDILGSQYIVLRKQSTSENFWGTYVRALSPTNNKLVIQVPHPVNDDQTGRQGAAVFYHADGTNFMVAGHNRCQGGNSGCHGQTGACVANGEDFFKASDLAHTANSIFHTATTVLATAQQQLVFLQLHGFKMETGDSHFYISCGTLDAHQKSVPDYAVILREHLLSINPNFDVTLTHVDNNSTLGARDNVQGRYLNEYPYNVCTDGTSPITVTNRFLHIEQYNNFREIGTYYVPMALAVNNAIDDNPYVRSIPIGVFPNSYTQTFDALSNVVGTHTWGNNLHLPGWYAVREQVGLFSNYASADGSGTTGGLYAYGDGISSDRALGTLNTGTETSHTAYGVLFKNKTSVPITAIHLNYKAEQWRGTNSSSQRVTLAYAISDSMDLSKVGLLNDALFTNVPAGDMVSVNNVANGAMDGTTTFTNITDLTIPVVVEDDQEIFIRFYDQDVPNTADKVMALDDFNVSFSTDPEMLVNWLSFEVVSNFGLPRLRWRTTNENDCERYEVLRSTTGKDFEIIATMSCQQLHEINDYEYIDHRSKLSPTIYYRIAQHDVDGRLTYSPIKTFLQKVIIPPKVYYENGSIRIEANRQSELQTASVFDFMGRELCAGRPAPGDSAVYSLECPYAANKLLLVKVVFDSRIYVVRLQAGD